LDILNNRYIGVRARIFDLLESQAIQQKDFADAVGVSVSTITDWKKGRSFSFAKKLDVIAQALGTTEEWLLTGNIKQKPEDAFIMNREFFVQNVRRLCQEKKIKPANACKESGVGGSFLSDIDRGQTPSVEEVQKLAEYLGATTGELLGEKETPTPVDGSGPRAYAHKLLDEIPPEKIPEALHFLEFIKATSGKE